jgi:hypothetical protein
VAGVRVPPSAPGDGGQSPGNESSSPEGLDTAVPHVRLAQSGRALPSHGRRRRFKPSIGHRVVTQTDAGPGCGPGISGFNPRTTLHGGSGTLRVVNSVNYSREQMRAYMQERRTRIRAEMVARLGGVCVQCGSVEVLEFDHKDPKTKLFAIANGLDRPRVELLAEVDKCQLLCPLHHQEKTRGDGSNAKRARGERSASARLTTESALAIKQAVGLTHRELAVRYGVSHTAVTNIRTGKTWKHI